MQLPSFESCEVRPCDALSEARLCALLDAAVDGIISIDENGLIQLVNPAVERMFGYVASELVGQNVKMLMPAPFRDEHDQYLARYRATGEKKIIGIGREALGARKDGTTFPIDLTVAEVRIEERRGFVGFIRDLTSRKEMEEKSRREHQLSQSLFDTTQAILLILDPEGRIVRCNPFLERLSGWTLEEVRGRDWFETFLPTRDRSRIRQLFHHALLGERTRGNINSIVTRAGEERLIEWDDAPLTSPEGDLLGVLAIGHDITERLLAQESARKSHEELEKLVAELGQKNEEIRTMTQQLWHAAKLASVGELAASIAHELNNPLATVSLRIESLLTRTPADDPRRRGLEIVEQETKRMAGLVANLLQFSRQGREEYSTLDAHEELSKALELIHHHLKKRQVSVAKDLAPEARTIYADRQRLRQVFLNLLTNAADAMPSGGTLTLRIAPATLENGRSALRIEFSDTGVGIDPEHLPRIMEPFFTTKEEGKGTGLGLAICRRIVQEHHGTISITSEPGNGTTVSLLLPVSNGANVDRLRQQAKS